MDGSGTAEARGIAGAAPDGLVIGTLSALSDEGASVSLALADGLQTVLARSMILLRPEDVGDAVVVMFAADDCAPPLVLGRLQNPAVAASSLPPRFVEGEGPLPEVTLDGERVELAAASEIVLRCGKASLTLTSSGKIVLRGTYILSRSSGPNKIRGGSIQLN